MGGATLRRPRSPRSDRGTRVPHGSRPDSELGSARELLARSYYHSAQLDRAADAARDILAKDPDHGYAALLLYRSLVRAGKRDEAERARLWATALGMDVSGRLTT